MENRFHRYLNLPFEIAKHPLCQTQPEVMKHLDINPYRDPQIDKWFESLGLICRHSEVFWTPAGASLPVHADEVTLDDHVKINLTFGPEEGKIRWWQSNKTQVVTDIETAKTMLTDLDNNTADDFSDREHKNVLANREDCTLVYEANTNRPSLVNVGQLHDTYSPPTEGRWTLCFVPGIPDKGVVYWDEALEIFKDYIIKE